MKQTITRLLLSGLFFFFIQAIAFSQTTEEAAARVCLENYMSGVGDRVEKIGRAHV